MMVVAIIGLAAIMSEKTPVNDIEPINGDRDRTLSEIILSEERFSKFSELVEAAGLTQELNEGGPYTIFVPSDEAFGDLPAETLNEILASETQALSILEYHIVEGNLTQENLLEAYREEEITNLSNNVLVIDENDEEVLVNEEMVIEPNILATNGVLHIISGILLSMENDTSNQTENEE